MIFSDECLPSCDFCVYAVYGEYLTDEDGAYYTEWPSGCWLHQDQWHQKTAEECGYCEDFKWR